MYIESLDLKNFRNYREEHIFFDPATNLLYGDNAQGKTNILEAVCICATTRSHRGSRDREVISFHEEESHIRARIVRQGNPYVIDLQLKKNRPKGIAVNGVPVRKASELFGTLNVVCFSPENLNLIKEGPAERRRFMDMELCQLDRLYVHALVSYNRILVQKNRLLKEMSFRGDMREMLDIYDAQQKEYAEQVAKYRKVFLEEPNELAGPVHVSLSSGKEELRLEYEKNEFRDLREEEIRQRTTLSGPHRDDIAILVNGMDLRRYGSQGQQRTAALSLKLAEIELVKKKIGEYPVLLLDDVLSELDTGRQNRLLEGIGHIQTVITCTGVEDYVNNILTVARTMHVEKGRVTAVSGGKEETADTEEKNEQ